ncbi:MAG: hypothetical protein R3F39_10720 [Myxococcota bacterium]
MAQGPHHRFIRALLAPLVILGLGLAACGGEAGEGESIAPSSVKSSDLEGYWYHEETGTVLAFQTAADAFWETFTWIDEVFDEPISTAWFHAGPASGGSGAADVRQAATWSVSGGHIDQTVLAEANGFLGGAGTQYQTQIKSFRAKEAMTLESGKTFTYGATCADLVPPGHFAYRATVDYGSEGNQACSGTFFVGFAQVAVDPDGGVHSVTTITDNNLSLNGTSLYPCAPLAAYWSGGCDARRWLTEYSDGQALTVDPTTMTVHSVHAVDDSAQPSRSLYRIRDIRSPDDAETFALPDDAPGTRQIASLVYARGETGTVVAGNTLYRRDGQTFTAVTPTLPGVGAPSLSSGAFGPDGRLYALSAQDLFIERADEPGAFDAVPLPRQNRDNGLGYGLAIGPDGVVHAAYPYEIVSSGGFVSGSYGVYARYDGTTWHETELGLLGRSRVAVTEAGQPIILHALVKGGGSVSYYLTRVLPDDTLDTWRVLQGVTETGTLDAWTVPSVAVGAGRVAYTAQGITVGVADLDALFDPARERPTAPLTLNFQGTGSGRVRSDDGLVDCTETCTVEVPVDRYLRFTTTPDAGSLALSGPGAPIGGGGGSSLRTGTLAGSKGVEFTVIFDASVTGRIFDAGALTLGEEVVSMATDDTRVAMLVRSPDGTFHYGDATLTAPAKSAGGLYLLTGPLGGPAQLRAVELGIDVDPSLARLAPGKDLELLYLVTNARTLGGAPVGTDFKSTVVRVSVTDEGVIGAPESLLTLESPAYVSDAAGDATGAQALFVETGSTLTAEGFTRRGFIVVDGGTATLHTFDNESVGGVVAGTLGQNRVDASGDAVLAAADGLLAYVVDGKKRWEVGTGDVIHGLDAGGPAPATITRSTIPGGSNGEVRTFDPATGAARESVELGSGLGAVVGFDTRPEARYWLATFGAFRAPAANTVAVRFLDDESLYFEWSGGFKFRRVTRASDGRAWLQLTLTGASIKASFQGRLIQDRRAFLVEMQPAGVAVSQ